MLHNVKSNTNPAFIADMQILITISISKRYDLGQVNLCDKWIIF